MSFIKNITKRVLETKDRKPTSLVNEAHSLNIETAFVDNSHKVHYIPDNILEKLVPIVENASRHSRLGRESQSENTPVTGPKAKKNSIDPIQFDGKYKGISLQLYSCLSSNSIGIGDFHDLNEIITKSANFGIDFVQINPINAINLFGKLEISPYLPISRFFLNPLYVRPSWGIDYFNLSEKLQNKIADIEATVAKNNPKIDLIDYKKVRETKLELFEILYSGLNENRKIELNNFCENEPKGLEEYCNYQVKKAKTAKKAGVFLEPKFYAYLEMLSLEQLTKCKSNALDQGMEIGLIVDLPVGCHPKGVDTEIYKDAFIKELEVGAPPDKYNEFGQNWSLNPFNRFYLEATDYTLFRNLISKIFSYAGAVRVDHILGMFRVWSIPKGFDASEGAYLKFDYQKMLKILVEEANKVNGLVIGEDLGTVPSYVRPAMKKNGILGITLLTQQHNSAGYLQPNKYKLKSLLSVLTHDHPPIYSWLTSSYLETFNNIGILSDYDKTTAGHKLEVEKLIQYLVKNDYLDIAKQSSNKDIILAIHKYMLKTACQLKSISLMDLTLQNQSINIPGTTSKQYPNWSIPLKDKFNKNVLLDDLFNLDLVKQVLNL